MKTTVVARGVLACQTLPLSSAGIPSAALHSSLTLSTSGAALPHSSASSAEDICPPTPEVPGLRFPLQPLQMVVDPIVSAPHDHFGGCSPLTSSETSAQAEPASGATPDDTRYSDSGQVAWCRADFMIPRSRQKILT